MNKFGHHREKSIGFRRLKKPLIIAMAFVGFFVISNYFMGSSNVPVTGDIIKPPVVPVTPKEDPQSYNKGKSSNRINNNIVNNNEDTDDEHQLNPNKNQHNIDTNKNSNKNKNNNNNNNIDIEDDKNSNFGTYATDESSDDPANDATASCVHTRARDYSKNPVVISGRFSGKADCDVPCAGDGATPDASVGYRQTQCPHIKSIFFTMENSIPPPGSYDIVANTQLKSDVPLPYFSWAEYQFDRPVQKKTATAHIAAFISNCGPQRRLQWMETMMKHGIKIHSYGSCMRNKDIPAEYSAKYGSDYNALKIALVATYKFTMSFENSATDDYVTEKLFGVLVSGSVPLYDGASNGKDFGPSKKSMIFANDYGTPEKLAEYLLYLDKNDTAYEEYLQWKKTGPSDDWVSLIDLANVHSNCRLCIRAADLHRKEVGPVRKGQPEGEPRPKGRSLELHVRERGKFWLRKIYLTSPSIEQLKTKINAYIPHANSSYLHSIQDLWSRDPIKTNDDIAKLKPKTEIEAIFVTPQNWEDRKLMW